MRKCEHCNEPAKYLCHSEAGVARCATCDARVHNSAEAEQHAREYLCELCGSASANVHCTTDAISLCAACDAEAHADGYHWHERVRVTSFTGPFPPELSLTGTRVAASASAADVEALKQEWRNLLNEGDLLDPAEPGPSVSPANDFLHREPSYNLNDFPSVSPEVHLDMGFPPYAGEQSQHPVHFDEPSDNRIGTERAVASADPTARSVEGSMLAAECADMLLRQPSTLASDAVCQPTPKQRKQQHQQQRRDGDDEEEWHKTPLALQDTPADKHTDLQNDNWNMLHGNDSGREREPSPTRRRLQQDPSQTLAQLQAQEHSKAQFKHKEQLVNAIAQDDIITTPFSGYTHHSDGGTQLVRMKTQFTITFAHLSTMSSISLIDIL